MPKFKKSSGYKMEGFSYPGESPSKYKSPMRNNGKTKEIPLTKEERQASMDTIAASRFKTERLYSLRSGDHSLINTKQYEEGERSMRKLDWWPRRVGDKFEDEKKAVKRSQDRLVKGTKTVKTKSKTRKNFDKAFASARKAGKATFDFEGKSYTTKQK